MHIMKFTIRTHKNKQTDKTKTKQNDGIKFEFVWVCLFFLIRQQNGACYVRNFRQFLFGVSCNVLAFKVCIFTSDFQFRSKWILEVNILTQILLILLTFIDLQFCERYQFVVHGFSLVWIIMYTFNLHLEERSMDNNNGKQNLSWNVYNIHLLQFKIQSHLQKCWLWMPVHQNSFQRKTV